MTRTRYKLLTAYYTARWRYATATKGFKRDWARRLRQITAELLKAESA